jgi:hypothetical protein
MIIRSHRFRRRVGGALLLAGLLAVGVTGSWAVEPASTTAPPGVIEIPVPQARTPQDVIHISVVDLGDPRVFCTISVGQFQHNYVCVPVQPVETGGTTPSVSQPAPTTQTPSTTAPTATTSR